MTRRLFDIWPANSALFNSENTSSVKWEKGAQTEAFSNPPFLRPWEEAGVINVCLKYGISVFFFYSLRQILQSLFIFV